MRRLDGRFVVCYDASMNETPDLDTMLDDLHTATRELLMRDDTESADDLAAEFPHISIPNILARLRSYDRDALTAELLAFSLCPLHRCDYAICFDDDDPECAAIRIIHPGHDT